MSVLIQCYGCGKEVDDEDLCILDCACSLVQSQQDLWKNVLVCVDCFHKLDPDMWISSRCWTSINPVIPFDELPDLCGHEMHWIASRIEEVRLGPHHQKMIQELREKKEKL